MMDTKIKTGNVALKDKIPCFCVFCCKFVGHFSYKKMYVKISLNTI